MSADFLPYWLTGDLSPAERLAQRMRGAKVDLESQPERPERLVPEDFEAVRYRIRTGLPMAPMSCWRW